jgi:hypothetical protein
MGKTKSKPLGERYGRGTAWEQQVNGIVYVNRPLVHAVKLTPTKKAFALQLLLSLDLVSPTIRNPFCSMVCRYVSCVNNYDYDK